MIDVRLVKNQAAQTVGFTVRNHGESHVCAAVSLLVINTVNSIESLTALGAEGFSCDYEAAGGYLSFILKEESPRCKDAGLLIDAMVLGLESVMAEHPSEIKIRSVTL